MGYWTAYLELLPLRNCHEISHEKSLIFPALVAIATSALAADYGTYKGKGGMAAYKIESNVYEYHYDKGFTGPDAMGWNPNTQFAWSRIAAAKVCGVTVSVEKLLPLLLEKFGEDKLVHEMIGIGFHEAQIKSNPKFCTQERIDELKTAIPDFNSGAFPKNF